ncbi:MAG: indole-3-glycerol phosphate synthase TrpC [Dehalococcoidia bacterium]|nr:MAG: indole-3-glycerol phosphate synthase TrpC [Dehalococcoidia bacterium]
MILQQILKNTRYEIDKAKRCLSLEDLKREILGLPQPIDLVSVLRGAGIKLIAEIKRASPSRGVIRNDFDPLRIAKIYMINGAAAISVLTETKYFKGNLNYLKSIKEGLGDKRIPLLRKDFILEPYQVYQSRVYGADSLLLIVAALQKKELEELVFLSHSLEMKCLIEVHSEDELGVALELDADIIGINNRNLNTFEIDLNTTKRLRPLIPSDIVVVSESGIRNKKDMEALKKWGVDAVLVGETLMGAPNIAARIKELL